jgi:hypothetical protein
LGQVVEDFISKSQRLNAIGAGFLTMTLTELTRNVSDDQRTILDRIWDYYLLNDKWIPAVALYKTLGKSSVLSNIKSLGGSIVFISRDADQRERFLVTFLGVLLTTKGPTLTLMFLQYLSYIKERLDSDYELKEIDGAQVRERSQLGPADSKPFNKALRFSPFSNGGSFGENTWTAGLPIDADDLFSEIGIQEYFDSTALKPYDPAVPTEGDRRMTYLNSKGRGAFPQSDSFQLPTEYLAEPISGQKYDVFLSYASQETNEARAIYDLIVAAGGKAFLSEKHLKAGEDFAESIRMALISSAEVWLLLSPNSLRSEWVASESGAAWGLGEADYSDPLSVQSRASA